MADHLLVSYSHAFWGFRTEAQTISAHRGCRPRPRVRPTQPSAFTELDSPKAPACENEAADSFVLTGTSPSATHLTDRLLT